MEAREDTLPVISGRKEPMSGVELVMIECQRIFLQVMYQRMDMLFYTKDVRL